MSFGQILCASDLTGAYVTHVCFARMSLDKNKIKCSQNFVNHVQILFNNIDAYIQVCLHFPMKHPCA